MVGDPERIRKAREVLQKGYRPREYSDEELRLALTDEEVKQFRKLRPLNTAWDKVLRDNRAADQPLQPEHFSPEQLQLGRASQQYQRLQRIVAKTLESGTPVEIEERRPKYQDIELKAALDLESLADYSKGRRSHAQYELLRRKAGGSMKVVRQTMPKKKYEALLLGRRLYMDALDIIHKKGAARPDQKATGADHTPQLEGPQLEGKLFTPEEEQRIKKVLNLDEIEQLVDGKRAKERQLPGAQASNEASRRRGRNPLVSLNELKDLQDKIDRFEELVKIVDERHERLLQAGQGQSASIINSKGTEKKQTEEPPNEGNDPSAHLSQQNPTQQSKQQSSMEEEGRRRPRLKPKPIRPNDPRKSVAVPASLTKEMNARLAHLDTQWQDVPRTIASEVMGGVQHQVIPWIGSLARTGPRIPTGIRAPVAL